MNVLYCCCNRSDKKRREDVYYMKDEEKKTASYSWDKDRLDPADFEYTGRCGEILLKTHNHINGQQFVIDNCKDCCILILDYTASVTIDGCEHCLIVTGPCKASIFLRNCTKCSIFTPCTQFRTRDCVDIEVFLFCITKPIIETSRSIRFHSLALYYENIEAFMVLYFRNIFINAFTWMDWSCDLSTDLVEIGLASVVSYKTVLKMDVLNSLNKVNLDYESSFFPVISILKNGDQLALIICIQIQGESDVNFTKKTLKLTSSMQHKKVRIFSLKQYHNKRSGTLPSILEALANSVSFVVIEVSNDHAQLESIIKDKDYCIMLSGGAIRLTKKYLHNLEP